MERKVKLKTLNSYITCQICQGYLIDATTVIECLHTFCKSCLVRNSIKSLWYLRIVQSSEWNDLRKSIGPIIKCVFFFSDIFQVKHLEENNTCPTCLITIHQSHPLNYISFDRTMQDIVYKLVPNLQEGKWLRVFNTSEVSITKDFLQMKQIGSENSTKNAIYRIRRTFNRHTITTRIWKR